MPPAPWHFDGPDAIRPLMADAAAMGQWRLIPVGANRMPAAASYLRRPGDSEFRAFKLDVMRIEAGPDTSPPARSNHPAAYSPLKA